MAHFIVEYRELGKAGTREEKRGDHIAYRKGLGSAMLLAGPLLDNDERVVGSIVILEAENAAEAEKAAAADPYVASGVFELLSIRRYRVAAMKPPQAGG